MRRSAELVRNDVDYVPIDETDGRIATTLLLVYPPGIATVVPGERLDERSRPMIDYLKAFERAANLFPGFENEIQGVYREIERGRAPCGSTPTSSANRVDTSFMLLSPVRGRGWERGLHELSKPPLPASRPNGGEEHER